MPMSSAQMIDYYLKLIADHPLLTFIEDPFADTDNEAYRNFKAQLSLKYPHVHISRKFKDMQHLQAITMWDSLTMDEEEELRAKQLEAEEAAANANVAVQELARVVGEKNSSKFTPHFASFRSG